MSKGTKGTKPALPSPTQERRTVLLVRRGHRLLITPPVAELGRLLRTARRGGAADEEHGYRVATTTESLAVHDTSWLQPGLSCPAGLEPVVRAVLTTRGYQIQTLYGLPPFPPPNVAGLATLPAVDLPLLDVLRTYPRGLVRLGPGVRPAWLIAQIARAWTEKPYQAKPFPEGFWAQFSVAIAVSRMDDALDLRDELRSYIPDVVTVTSKRPLAEVGRVVVATYQSLIQSPITLGWRDVLIALDAVEAVSKRHCEALPHAERARLFGFLPMNATPSPWEQDMLTSLFGFRDVLIPRHGHHVRDLRVLQVPIGGGPAMPSELTTLALKQQGIWQHPLRNRRIARLARTMQEGTAEALQDALRSSNAKLDAVAALVVRQRRTLVLVEGVEHGLALAEQLPDWPLVASPALNMAGLSRRHRQRLEQGRSSGWEGSRGAIVTFAGLKDVALADVDVVVRADGGTGLPPFTPSQLVQPNNQPLAPLLVVDFDDRHHPELRQRSRARREAYTERGWHAPGVHPIQVRVQQFLASRPEGETS